MPSRKQPQLTHWGRVTHICVSELTIIGSDNGMSPGRRQAIIWNNPGLLLNEPLGTNFSEISIGIETFSFKNMHLNMSSAKWIPASLLNLFLWVYRLHLLQKLLLSFIDACFGGNKNFLIFANFSYLNGDRFKHHCNFLQQWLIACQTKRGMLP